jgi:micrococcal nuclease
MYTYQATVLDVIDGDTIRCDVDLGLDVAIKMTVRLLGVNTPELSGPDRDRALKAKAFVKEAVQGNLVVIKTVKDRKEKYGRYLAEVFVGERSVNQDLLAHGLAVTYP